MVIPLEKITQYKKGKNMGIFHKKIKFMTKDERNKISRVYLDDDYVLYGISTMMKKIGRRPLDICWIDPADDGIRDKVTAQYEHYVFVHKDTSEALYVAAEHMAEFIEVIYMRTDIGKNRTILDGLDKNLKPVGEAVFAVENENAPDGVTVLDDYRKEYLN